MTENTSDFDWLMSLADEIGGRIEAGCLPPQDAYGRYILDHAAADVARTVRERS